MRTMNQVVISSCIAIAAIVLVASSRGDARQDALQRSDVLAQSTRVADVPVPDLLRLADEQLGPQAGCGAQCGRLNFCCGGCFAGECQECCPISAAPVHSGTE
jgi:hypothetical protein